MRRQMSGPTTTSCSRVEVRRLKNMGLTKAEEALNPNLDAIGK